MMETVTFARYGGETARIIFAPIYIGLARGYFAEAGVELTVVEPREYPWVAVARQEVDSGAGFVDYCVDPAFRGKMLAVAVHEQFRSGHGLTTLLARRELVERGELSSYASLRGKSIGLLEKRGDDYLAYYGALKQGGLTIDDVRIAPVPHSGSGREDALAASEIDLMIGRRPRSVAQEIERGNVVRWKVGDEVHPDLQARYIFFSQTFMRDRPELGVRFLSAYLRGARDYCDAFDKGVGREQMLELLVEQTGESRELLETMKPLGFAPNGRVDLARLAIEAEALAERGLIPPATGLEAMVDNRWADRAVEALGEYVS